MVLDGRLGGVWNHDGEAGRMALTGAVYPLPIFAFPRWHEHLAHVRRRHFVSIFRSPYQSVFLSDAFFSASICRLKNFPALIRVYPC